jgi:hypothetical protein
MVALVGTHVGPITVAACPHAKTWCGGSRRWRRLFFAYGFFTCNGCRWSWWWRYVGLLKLEQAVVEVRTLEPSSSKADLVKRGQLSRGWIEKLNGWLRKRFGNDLINWWPGAFYVNKFDPVERIDVYPSEIGIVVKRIVYVRK